MELHSGWEGSGMIPVTLTPAYCQALNRDGTGQAGTGGEGGCVIIS
jgi:hypothetical protein